VTRLGAAARTERPIGIVPLEWCGIGVRMAQQDQLAQEVLR
jgi:hypothetical protein